MNQKHFVILFILLFIGDFVSAAEEQPRLLVITGSPMQHNIEGSSEQLEDYDIQAIIDAGDLLTRFPGFSAIRAGGHGIDPVLRGQSQTRINLLQQGAFLHGAGPNRMDSPGAYTEPFGWDEVQIIKGVETLIFGSGGPAGTINFKRYKPVVTPAEVSGKLMAAYSPDYYKIGADLAIGNDLGYLRLITQRHDQDSYEDGDGNLTRTAFITDTTTIVVGYTPNEFQEWRLSLMANRGEDALFAGTMMDGVLTDMDALQLMFLDGDQDSNDYSEYQLYWNDAHHIMDNFSLRTQTAPMRMLTDSFSTTTGAKWMKRWQAEASIWQVSFDWQNIDRHAKRFMGMMGMPSMLQSNVWPETEIDIKGVAIEAEYPVNQQIRIKSGVRYDRVKAEARSLKTTSGAALYQNYYLSTPAKSEEDNVSGFSRIYVDSEELLYWAGISSTVRTADATERYLGANSSMPMMAWIGNPDIQPERHNQFELGGKWRFQDGWSEISVYYDAVDDFILRDRARMQSGIAVMNMATIYRNVDAAFSGFEMAVQKQFATSWNIYANLAYVDGNNEDTDLPLSQIPPVEGLIQLSNENELFTYWVDLRFAFEQDDVDDNMMTGSALDAGEADSWATLDFKIKYRLNQNWQLSAGVNNIFDETYAYHVSRRNMDPFSPEAVRVNEPGRQLWMSILMQL